MTPAGWIGAGTRAAPSEQGTNDIGMVIRFNLETL